MTPSDHADAESLQGLLAALRVPLILIGLGCLFLVGDYGGPPASRTWPALLVLWGALTAIGWRRRGA